MMELIQLREERSGTIKKIKNNLLVQKQTRTEAFKQTSVKGQDVMLALQIIKHTLQTLRDTGILPYSRINGIFFYKGPNFDKLMESNYSQTLKNESHV